MEYLGHLQFLHQNSMNSSHAHVKLLCQVAHRQSSVFLQGVVHWRNQTLIYFRFPAPAFFFLQRCSAVFEPFEPLKHQRTANSWSSRCTFHQICRFEWAFSRYPNRIWWQPELPFSLLTPYCVMPLARSNFVFFRLKRWNDVKITLDVHRTSRCDVPKFQADCKAKNVFYYMCISGFYCKFAPAPRTCYYGNSNGACS